jgi:hypothetical protein
MTTRSSSTRYSRAFLKVSRSIPGKLNNARLFFIQDPVLSVVVAKNGRCTSRHYENTIRTHSQNHHAFKRQPHWADSLWPAPHWQFCSYSRTESYFAKDALHETVKRGMDTSAARTTGGGSCGLQSFGRRTARNTTKLEFARWLRSI